MRQTVNKEKHHANFKKSLVALAGVLLLAGTVALVSPRISRGQMRELVGPTRPVEVVNAPSNPVPVTGTVTIGNLGGAPLPVRDVDNPARQPFQASLAAFQPFDPPLLAVPAGKSLVIEYVSADSTASPDCGTPPRYELRTTAGGTTLDHFFYPEDAGIVGATVNDARRTYGLSRQTRIYADPNTQVRLDVRTSGFPACGYINSPIHISGHLVDVPWRAARTRLTIPRRGALCGGAPLGPPEKITSRG